MYQSLRYCFCILIFCYYSNEANAQVKSRYTFNSSIQNAFLTSDAFIENKGQYGSIYKGQENLGSILFGFEGNSMPILFTKRGIIFLQRKVEEISKAEEENLEKQGIPEDEIEQKKVVTDRAINMEWIGANLKPQIVLEEKTYAYHTYGMLQQKAFGYKKITFKNLYTGIDLVYHFTPNSKIGFEYSFNVAAGADISQIKMRYGGDVKSIKIEKQGNLLIKSDIEGILQNNPISFYKESNNQPKTNQLNNQLTTTYKITNKQISFTLKNYDNSKPLTIDPFISSTSNLNGANAGKAKDIDFDYAGNIYVTGGGDVVYFHRLAKYNAAGVLMWTFNGMLTSPVWTFGDRMGGWVVEKTTGKIYLGQGIGSGGFKVVRLSTSGIYDNYISTPFFSFSENWKMFWSCNNSNPQIFIAGGGTNTNSNLSILVPPSTNLSPLNLTGINFVASTSGYAQDIVDIVNDPISNDIYSIYASFQGTPFLNDRIYKNATPYAASTIVWDAPSGFTVLEEVFNRPYLTVNNFEKTDNSANIFALNQTYLFYWDGKNLKAINKATGAGVGTPLITSNVAKMCGGIYADACNNVYVGSVNGTIKVYNFNGSIFDDAPADILINGYETRSVYDIAFNDADKLLYASGDGFVASFELSNCTANAVFTLNVSPSCPSSATATVTPAPFAGTIVTYSLYQGTNFITSNTTGIFNNLTSLVSYKIKATLNAACSGIQLSKDFVIPGPTITTSFTNETCNNAQGQIIAQGAGTIAPYTYSINGTTFFASGTFSGLSANTYTITVKDANGCINTKQVTIINTSFTPTFTTNYNGTSCGNSTGTINATAGGGIAPYQYSITGGSTYQSSSIFSNLAPGQYQLKIRDVNGCLSTTIPVDISPSYGVGISITAKNTTCGFANGIITATNIDGASPFLYSINGGAFLTNATFTGLASGTAYTIRIKDANGCLNTSSIITLTNINAATVIAEPQNSTCGFANGKIIAIPSGGTVPFAYSINNGITYQLSDEFTGLTAGISYSILIKDSNNCVSSSSNTTVSNTVGATVSATSQNATCGNPNGKIIAKGMAGTLAYQYSLDNNTYQSSPIFNNKAPQTYTVFIKDGNDCVSSTSVTVGTSPIPTLKVFAGNDTSVAINQPLILNAKDVNNVGFVSYTWSPTFGLNDATRQNPTAVLEKDFAYKVKATTTDGCTATDSLKVKITYGTEIYVPSAFTPNGDTKNDVLRPRLIGIKMLKYFMVYNRYGELVFRTTNENKGWDGTINGSMQNTGTYVWIVEGEDYKGKSIIRKGMTMLVK